MHWHVHIVSSSTASNSQEHSYLHVAIGCFRLTAACILACRVRVRQAMLQVCVDNLKIEVDVAVGARENPPVTNTVSNMVEVKICV